MRSRLHALVQRLDALSQRDRLTLAAGLVAALAGLELQVVMPLRDKRLLIERSAAEEVSSQNDARAAAQAQRLAQLAQLNQRSTEIGRQIDELGLGQASPHNPAGFIAGALQGSRAALVSLRGLPVQELAPPAPDAAASAPAVPVFFRHRAELRLQGSIGELTQALQVLEHGAAPLRIERVLIGRGESGPALQALVVLTAINQERTWFAL